MDWGLPTRLRLLKDTYRHRAHEVDRNIKLLVLGSFLYSFGLSAWQLMFNLFLNKLDFSKSFIGNILSLSHLAVAVMALPAGIFIARRSLKWTIFWSHLWSSLLLILSIVWASRTSALLGLTALSFGTMAFFRVAYNPLVMEYSTSRERTYAFSFVGASSLLAGFFGNIFFGMLHDFLVAQKIDELQSFEYSILFGMTLSMISAAPIWFMKEKIFDTKNEKTRKERYWKIPHLPKKELKFYFKAVFPSFLVAVGAGLIVQFMNLYFHDVFGAKESQIGFYMGLQSVTMFVGYLIIPPIAEYFGKVKTIVGAQLLSIPFMLILGFTSHLSLAVFALVMRATLMNMSAPVSSTLVMELCPKDRQGFLNALYMISFSLAWAFSAHIFGTVINGDYRLSFIIASMMYVTSSILYYFFFSKVEKTANA